MVHKSNAYLYGRWCTITLFLITCHATKLQYNCSKFLQILFSTKYDFFFKKVKMKKYSLLLIEFFSFFAFLSLFFSFFCLLLCQTIISSSYKFFCSFVRRALCSTFLKIVFDKKAVAKFSRISNSTSSPWNLVKFLWQVFIGKCLNNIVLIFVSFDSELA